MKLYDQTEKEVIKKLLRVEPINHFRGVCE